ncbi:MAG: glycosyltransferase family 4 protein [Pseudochelatococcus sp.]|jgi:glycosyltransferase involved in cell wall biosynthesis|uniref:glycosyltransferase family 4 protein n=1 Tax=Pseudochelatococcus sp. TaxID=2020869 RepID=UPI003D8D7305
MLRVTHFMRRPGPNAFSMERLYEDVRQALPADCRVKVWICRHFSRGFWPRVKDVWLARAQQGDVNHVTGDVHYLTFLLDSRRTVLTVHDLVMLERLRGVRRFALWLLWYWLPVQRSRAIVVISETTRSRLLDSVRCDPGKVVVIHNNVSDEFRPVPRTFADTCPRILQIGTKTNKNLERVAEALSGMTCRLVIVGPLSEAQQSMLHRYGIDYESHVGLSREALVAQYVAADMLLFASTYEGFGLPIVEAQAVGRPVVTSNLSAMPEVAGEAACLVNPFDVTSIRAGVQRLVNDAAYRNDLIARGLENAKRFRASQVAARYAALYRGVAEGAGQGISREYESDPGRAQH